MSKKTVSFSVPDKGRGSREPAGGPPKRRAADIVIEPHADDWVSDRHNHADEAPAKNPAAPSLILDLAAERGLMEVFALSLLAPFALGFFWLVNAMAGRVRF